MVEIDAFSDNDQTKERQRGQILTFDIIDHFRPDLATAPKWPGRAAYHFIGGNNDAAHTPSEQMAKSITDLLAKDGKTLATYHLDGGPQGYLPLRRFLSANLASCAAIQATAEQILITSGSGQAIDLISAAALKSGDNVITEEACYAGALNRFRGLGAQLHGTPLDDGGIVIERLAELLENLQSSGQPAKLLYTIPTAQNPTGSVMDLERRLQLLELARQHDLTIFEDECYADLIFDGDRPPALRALDQDHRTIYCGTFSKSIAPALRVGYIVADWPVISRLLPLKNDGGTGALDQMAMAAWTAQEFDEHVQALRVSLDDKRHTMAEALAREFGTSAEVAPMKGGIFLWITFPEKVDTTRLAQAALAEGIAINPGADWSADPQTGRNKIRLCFANPPKDIIDEGITKLAKICHREFGIPTFGHNIVR